MRVGKFNRALSLIAIILLLLILLDDYGYIHSEPFSDRLAIVSGIFMGAMLLFVLIDPYSFLKIESFYIPRSRESKIIELLAENGFVFDNALHGDRIYIRKGSNDFTNLLVKVRELGNQIVIETAGPRAMRKELKKLSSWSERKAFSF